MRKDDMVEIEGKVNLILAELNQLSDCALPAHYSYYDHELIIKCQCNQILNILERIRACQECETGIAYCNTCKHSMK